MTDRLLIDTGVFVAIDRGQFKAGDVIAPSADVAIAMITVAELLEGVEQATTVEIRGRRQAFVDKILAAVVVEGYTIDVARAHAQLLAHTRRSGRPRGSHDLMIAATAAQTGRTLLTLDNKADFGSLPGVQVKLLNPNGSRA